jgi:hypothetical protein
MARVTLRLSANASLFASHNARLSADKPVTRARGTDGSDRLVFDLANSWDLQTTLLSLELLRN